MRNISIHKLEGMPLEDRRIEYVERKGIGHPDSLIDGIVDATSHALCREYLDTFGGILHHNVDKGLIIGGASKVGFGHGEITKKIEVIITGRATAEAEGKKIDVDGIAKRVAKNYFKENTRYLNVDTEITFDSKIANGSLDLISVFKRGHGIPLANDTSFGIGFAPFSDTEKLVLETERYLNSNDYKKLVPAVGEDVKVMGMRDGNQITLTIAIAFIAELTNSIDQYVSYKERIRDDIEKFAEHLVKRKVTVKINAADPEDGDDVYLTKTGLSCEAGDDGSVGRGNRVNGLITPFRHMSLEAAAGKNPINHIGKIYNILATEMASRVVGEYSDILECNIAIVSQIGKRIDEPHNLSMELALENGANFDEIKAKANYVAEGMLEDIQKLTMEISIGKYKTF